MSVLYLLSGTLANYEEIFTLICLDFTFTTFQTTIVLLFS